MAFTVLLTVICSPRSAMSQTFYATSPSGHSLRYSITSTTEHTVSLVNGSNNSQFNASSNVVISDTVYYEGVAYTVTDISGQALNVPMYSLTIPRTIRTIGYHPFSSNPNMSPIHYYNTMRKLYFNADSCESSGGLWAAYNYWMPAFKDCHQLDTVIVGEHVKNLPYKLFSDCAALRCVVMGDSVHSIGEDAFFACSLLDSIRISSSLRHIGDMAFSYTAIRHIDLPNTMRTIGGGAFTYCDSLRVMIMPDSIDSVGSNLFSGCPNLQRVHLSNSVTHLYEQSFFYCTSLSDVDFGTGIMVIDERAFYNCSSLHSVVLPASLDSIKEGCFWACTIDTVTLLSTTPPVTQGSVFPSYGEQNYAIPVYIPCGTMTAYQAAPTWSSFTNKIERSGYDLILQVNDAEMGRAEVQVEPTCAAPAVITAIANTGYRFVAWNDGDTNAVRTLLLVSDTTFTAYFAPDTMPVPQDTLWRTVTVTTNVSSAAEAYGSGFYVDSSTVEIGYHLADTTTVGGHWQFFGWNDGGTGNPRHILVTSDTAIIALFEWVAGSTEGINELSIVNSQFSIYPNPATHQVSIECAETISEAWLTDLTGRREQVRLTAEAPGRYTLDLTARPQATYLLTLTTASGKTHTVRLLIQ